MKVNRTQISEYLIEHSVFVHFVSSFKKLILACKFSFDFLILT